eukprot:gnl/TRDRNA2_/TRDRNA2_197789_c0_seq1.p1 gnl/TRDRNA2_/TRDRNA2_197789_c0~~gnl/TRDRNA2_/TRDRNA2_197789_c0_seq1.p1  ORF type:complete len:188 (+),score=57.80 gnl/TRDRNA2_/TRDRNA2_197789_c0_seq1:65-565(+)
MPGGVSRKERAVQAEAKAALAELQRAEDASWEIIDKTELKKMERALAKEQKADSKLHAKQERKQIEEAEEVASKKTGKQAPVKVTLAEIARRTALAEAAAAAAARPAKAKVVPQPRLELNPNHADPVDVQATGLDSALAALEELNAGRSCDRRSARREGHKVQQSK